MKKVVKEEIDCIRKIFGKFIKGERLKKEMTQTEAARKAEIDQTQWSKIENGKRILYGPKELLNIAKVLDIPLIKILKKASGKIYNK